MNERRTWRQILKHHSTSYRTWLKKTDWEFVSLDCLSTHLSEFLIGAIRSEADARKFWDVIPVVRAACNEPATYEIPWAAEAYAYVHLLHRYRRTWAVLNHLTADAVLPLGAQGVRALDIGTGPAPALYAIEDFYASLGKFANKLHIKELCIPPVTLNCIENSPSMARFIHHFSEYCQRRGPFGPTIADFSDLDFQAKREFHFRSYKYETYWDPHTEEYEEWYDPHLASEESSRLFRYRLIVFSNFLTLGDTVSGFEKELRALFNDLRAGSVVIVLGATGGAYQDVYAKLAQIANDARLTQDQWDTDQLGEMSDERFSTRIKAAQHRVYVHLAELAVDPPLPQTKPWPDYWTPQLSPKVRSKFALRVFRCGRWPTKPKKA